MSCTIWCDALLHSSFTLKAGYSTVHLKIKRAYISLSYIPTYIYTHFSSRRLLAAVQLMKTYIFAVANVEKWVLNNKTIDKTRALTREQKHRAFQIRGKTVFSITTENRQENSFNLIYHYNKYIKAIEIEFQKCSSFKAIKNLSTTKRDLLLESSVASMVFYAFWIQDNYW